MEQVIGARPSRPSENQINNGGPAALIARQKRRCIEYIQSRCTKKQRGWPIVQKRAVAFQTSPQLTEMRLLPAMMHRSELIPGEKRLSCALCGILRTRYQCQVCKVALCVAVKEGELPTCSHFSRWHTVPNALLESQKAKQEILDSRALKGSRI